VNSKRAGPCGVSSAPTERISPKVESWLFGREHRHRLLAGLGVGQRRGARYLLFEQMINVVRQRYDTSLR
jgi:hypothetical protein